MSNLRLSSLLIVSLLSTILGCASTPTFDTRLVDKSLTPQSVLAEPAISLGKVALWGGTILDTRNLQDSMQLEILAYPLNSSHRPMLDKKPLGRFIIKRQGFLEPTSYAQGRLLSVLGDVQKSQSGKVGESQYSYPVINARQLHLWNPDDEKSNTRFHFGIGIGL